MAVLEGINWGRSLTQGPFRICSNIVDTITSINSVARHFGPEGATLEIISRVLETTLVWGFFYNPRASNLAAQELARFALSSSHPHAWVETGVPA